MPLEPYTSSPFGSGGETGFPPWALLCLLVAFLFFALKGISWWAAGAGRRGASRARTMGYLVAWVGMDARAFLDPSRSPRRPGAARWFLAGLNAALGAGLLSGMVGRISPGSPLLAGWLGMLGLVLLLHFGFFHLLSLLWQHHGVLARPIMSSPVLATSLSGFWGRWNLAFHQLADDLVHRPLRRRLGPAGAIILTFAVSGLVHELVISVPAGGGFGFPLLYFLLQGLGVVLERSAVGKTLGIRRGARGRLFMAAVTALPVFWLFHPPFVSRVVLPFLRALGAL